MTTKEDLGKLVVATSTDPNRFNLSVERGHQESHGDHRKRAEALIAELKNTYGDDVTLLKKGASGGQTFVTVTPGSEAHAHLTELAAEPSRGASR